MRDLVPADKLTFEAIDSIRKHAEAAAAYNVAITNSYRVLDYGVGGSQEAELRNKGLLVSSFDDADIVVENLLPFTHLAVGALGDRWITAALVAATAQNLINAVVLGRDQALAIYGLANFDAFMPLGRVNISSGPATLMAEWDVQRLYASLTPEGYTDEAPLFKCSEAVTVTVMPVINSPASPLVLYAAFASHKGTFITK